MRVHTLSSALVTQDPRPRDAAAQEHGGFLPTVHLENIRTTWGKIKLFFFK
jgi:hypothetical protein